MAANGRRHSRGRQVLPYANSRLTDPKILELRFPVVLEDFHIREVSGGRGRWHASDGTSLTSRVRETMNCTILSGQRKVAPFGLKGGDVSENSRNLVHRTDGRIEELAARA